MSMNLDQSADKITPSSGTLNIAGAILPTTALAVGSGGTGLTSLTAGYIPFGNGTSAFSSSSGLTYSGTALGVTGSITSSGYIASGGAVYVVNTGVLSWGPSGTFSEYLSANNTLHFMQFVTNSAEAMRIDTSGNLLVACTAVPSASVAGFQLSSPLVSAPKISAGSTTTGVTMLQFFNGNGSVGYISTSGSLTSYNVSSDRRLKENIVPLTTGLSNVLKLKPSTFNYIADKTTSIDGFIADELQAVVPFAVTGKPNAVDAEGVPVYQGVDSSFLIPHLVSAIQELNNKFDAYVASHP